MPISEYKFNQISEEILKELNSHTIDKNKSKNRIKNYLYNLLTKTKIDVDLFLLELLQKQQELNKTINIINSEDKGRIKITNKWLRFELSKEKQFELLKKTNIAYKRYYTIEIPKGSSETALKYIKKFYSSLPELHEKLNKLAKDNDSLINFKVPLEIQTLLTHIDSLIIHFSKKHLDNTIHKTVINHLEKHKIVHKKRFHRTEKGFDLIGNSLKNDRSHSMLIADVLGDIIFEHETKFNETTKQELIEWLKISIRKVNNYSQETFIKLLNK